MAQARRRATLRLRIRVSRVATSEWRNWQTRWLKVPVPVRAWGFKSPLRHISDRVSAGQSRYLSVYRRPDSVPSAASGENDARFWLDVVVGWWRCLHDLVQHWVCFVHACDDGDAGGGGEGGDGVDGGLDGDEVGEESGEECADGEAGVSPESVDADGFSAPDPGGPLRPGRAQYNGVPRTCRPASLALKTARRCHRSGGL